MIRKGEERDLGAIRDILNENIRTSTAVYHYEERSEGDMAQWFSEKQEKGFPLFVWEEEHKVVAYATYGAYRPHAGYNQTVEHSVYVSTPHQGKGIGGRLLDCLLRQAKEDGFHVMVAYIDAANEKSVQLHEKKGFLTCGLLREVGFKFGRYLDLVIMECFLKNREF